MPRRRGEQQAPNRVVIGAGGAHEPHHQPARLFTRQSFGQLPFRLVNGE
jgi:hypothetical protein